MTESTDPFTAAIQLASEFEEILEVPNLSTHIETLNGSLSCIADIEKRDIGPGEFIGIAGLFVGLVSLMIQIRAGNTYQGEPREKIIERLILKLGEETSLPAKTREKLIIKLIDVEFNKLD